jgi:hypothetical protein
MGDERVDRVIEILSDALGAELVAVRTQVEDESEPRRDERRFKSPREWQRHFVGIEPTALPAEGEEDVAEAASGKD